MAKKDGKTGIGFKLFGGYIRFFHNRVFYRKTYWLNTENIPEGQPLMIVSNHQNCLADALGMLFAIPNRKHRQLRILSRADVFKPAFAPILRWLGILPAFRLEYDGADTVGNNAGTFNEAQDELKKDGTVIIYPEAGHQDKRWLGKFSYGYLRLLFEAAEQTGFQKEMFVLPACNHYSGYYNMREDILIKFGTPISIAAFYELYKTKPRTAQRQVNALVREQISQLMLNITDLENYETIDYLRVTYGLRYACRRGYTPDKLPEKLLADKELFAALERLKADNEEKVNTIYNDASIVGKAEQVLRIDDADFDHPVSGARNLLEGLLYALLLLPAVAAAVPNLLIYAVPSWVNTKFNDRMFHSSVKIGSAVLITIPITVLLLFGLTWYLTSSALTALLALVILPFLGIFARNFNESRQRWLRKLRFNRLLKAGKLDEIKALRTKVFESLDTLLN